VGYTGLYPRESDPVERMKQKDSGMILERFLTKINVKPTVET